MPMDLLNKEDELRREEKLGKETNEVVVQVEFNSQTKKKKKRRNREALTTKSDIFENTPKLERTLNLMIPSGLSPPDFSAIKVDQEMEEKFDKS